MCLIGKSKTPDWAFGAYTLEHQPLWFNGHLVRGVLDKAAIGASGNGLVHSIFELYGPFAASLFLDSIGRVLSSTLQYFGHSCGMADLVLTPAAEATRKAKLERAKELAAESATQFLADNDAEAAAAAERIAASGGAAAGAAASTAKNLAEVQARLGILLSKTAGEGAAACAALDSDLQGALADPSSDAIKSCLPRGLVNQVWSPGPNSGGLHANGFGLMVSTGAKGSGVNQSQVTVCLGQQALEGKARQRQPKTFFYNVFHLMNMSIST